MPAAARDNRSSVGICLIGGADAFVTAAAGAAPITADPSVKAVIITEPGGSAGRGSLSKARDLADRHDVAFLLADDAALAAEIGADGVQIEWAADRYSQARKALGDERTVGCLVGLSRHAAMEAAEAGADYVGFGHFGPNDKALSADAEAEHELVAWWAGVFEVPCVAIAEDNLDALRPLIEAAPEFIALPPSLWTREVIDRVTAGHPQGVQG